MFIKFNIIKNNIKNIFKYKTIFLSISVFIILFSFQQTLIKELSPKSLFEYITYYFYGVNYIAENIGALFAWTIFQLFFILTMVSYLYNEFHGRNIYIISRVGNKSNWFAHLEVTIILSSIIYFFIGFSTLTICSFFINNNIIFSDNYIKILLVFIVISLNSFFYINLFLLISLKFNHNTSSILWIVILIFLNIDLGDRFKLDLYNPFTQCIFSKFYINGNSFSNSIFILSISNILIMLCLYRTIVKKDLLNITI